MVTKREREAALRVIDRTSAERLIASMDGHGHLDLQRWDVEETPRPTLRQIATVVRGLADYTHCKHMLSDTVRKGLNYPLWGDTEPEDDPAAILGRYFHAVADQLRQMALEEENG